jgi:hypothetical protein
VIVIVAIAMAHMDHRLDIVLLHVIKSAQVTRVKFAVAQMQTQFI